MSVDPGTTTAFSDPPGHEAPPTGVIKATRGRSALQLSVIIAVGALITGLFFFRSTERTFADII